MTNNKLSIAGRRYLRRFFPAMTGYVVVLFASLWVIENHNPKGPLLWILGVAPAIPVVGVIAAMGLYLMEETDEFLRTVLIQSMLWGIGITLGLATAWGFLENVGALPHFPLYLIFAVFCGAFGLSQPFVRRRYQ
jgi:hypothetical protein